MRFEYFWDDVKKWFTILLYSPENGYFACIFEDITERKKAEEALKESEENFRNLAEQSPNMIYINQKGKVVYANTEAEEVTGYKKEEFYSPKFNYMDLIAPESKELVQSLFIKHAKGESVRPYEFKVISKKGQIIDVINSTKIIDYNGEPAILGVETDITERKKAEEALMESEANYRNLINGMSETAWVIDFNGNFVEVNGAAIKTLGYSREELLTMGLKDIEKAFSKEGFKNHLKSMPAAGTKIFESVHLARDGREIPVEISSSLITYHGEQAKLSIARNITERKKAEEALIESEEIFSKAFQSSPAMLTITRVSDNRIIDINDAFLNLFGYTREEVVGHTAEELNLFPDYDSREKIVSEVLKQGRTRNQELVYQTKTGKKLTLLASIEIVNIHGERHLLVSLLDATNHMPTAAPEDSSIDNFL
ncbi:MAG: PAS domain S-box protein [Candidatus Bathyarchaeia archaeon]